MADWHRPGPPRLCDVHGKREAYWNANTAEGRRRVREASPQPANSKPTFTCTRLQRQLATGQGPELPPSC